MCHYDDTISRINSIPFPQKTVWDKDRFPQLNDPYPYPTTTQPFPFSNMFTAPQGWQCPQCRKVYAPHVDECASCNHKDSMSASVPTETTAYVLTENDGNLTVRKITLEDKD